MSPRRRCRPKPPPQPSAAIGELKTNCIGCSTSSSTKTSPGCARAMAQPTWRSSAISPSIRSEPRQKQNALHGQPPDRVASIPAPPRAKPASSFVEKSPDGTSNTYQPSSSPKSVNLDREPCRRGESAKSNPSPPRDHGRRGRGRRGPMPRRLRSHWIDERQVDWTDAADRDDRRLIFAADHPVVMRSSCHAVYEAAGRRTHTRGGVEVGAAVDPPSARDDD